jgi:hypothetical protein
MTIRTSEITLPTFQDIRNNIGGYEKQVNEGYAIRFLLSPSRPSQARPQQTARMLSMAHFRHEWGDRAVASIQLTLFQQQPKYVIDRLNHYGAIVVRHAGQKQDLFAIIKESGDEGI